MWGVPCYVQIHLISKKIDTTFLFLEQWIKQMWTLSYQLSISDVNYLDQIPITQFVLCVHLASLNFCFLFCEMPTSERHFFKLEFLKQWNGSVLKVLPTKPSSLCCTQRTQVVGRENQSLQVVPWLPQVCCSIETPLPAQT